MGFQEQSGGPSALPRTSTPKLPNSLGFQEQSGGLVESSHRSPGIAEQLGISGTVRRPKSPPSPVSAQSAEQLGISGTVRRQPGRSTMVSQCGRTAWDFRNSQAERRGGRQKENFLPNSLGFQEQSGGESASSKSVADFMPNSLGFQEQSGGWINGELEARELSRTAWDFRNSQAVKARPQSRLRILCRTAWDFRNSQAGGSMGSSKPGSSAEQLGISGTVRRLKKQNSQKKKPKPNSLGFQEQSGGSATGFPPHRSTPNSLGFQEQSGGA